MKFHLHQVAMLPEIPIIITKFINPTSVKIRSKKDRNSKIVEMKYISIFILLCTCSTVYSQKDFRKGIIIKHGSDTLTGELAYNENTENSQFVEFRNQETGLIYRPFEIEGYAFEKGKYYVSKTALIDNDTLQVFAEYLVKGKRDLFFVQNKSRLHFLISVSDTIIRELPYKLETVNIGGVNYRKETKHFSGLLKLYFNDCPSLFSTIDKMKLPERKSLISLTKEYHDITCGEGSCVVYGRKEYPIRVVIEPVYSYYLKNKFLNSNSFGTYGTNLYLWLPNSSERIYFKTGIFYATPASYTYIKIPIQFQYVYHAKVFKPKFDFGLNLHSVRENKIFLGGGITAHLGTGFYLKLANRTHLSFDINSDVFSFDYETKLFESFSAGLGLRVDLGK